MSESEGDFCHPVTNVEETIGKTVGRRKPPRGMMRIQEVGKSIYRAQGFRVCPKGVYRFESHEEADAWWMKMAVKRALEIEKGTES